jgi:chromosome segregation ATPase
MLQDLEKDILVKTETNHALEETITSLKRDYENRMKFDAVEKAAMEEDISTLQQRLREETQERDDVEYRLSSRLETLTDELRELKLKNSELRQSLDDLCHQHESTVIKLQSEKKTKAVIEEQVVELERRLAEEVKYREEISNQFENKFRTSNQELRDKVSIIDSLSLEINKAQEEIKVAHCRIASELDQNNIMANELSALENRLADEVEKYATYKEQNTRYVKDMQACIEEEKQINSKLSNEILTLKMEHESIQGKLAASVTERMKEKASLEAQTSCLETELEELSGKNDVLKKTVQDLTQENESLKDRVQAECQKLTAELTERMKEKAFYDNEVAKLSSIIEKTTQECSHLQEEILECKAALSASEDRLASSINEKEIFMNRIAYFENALKDCCSSKKELEDNIQALQSEKEELIRFNDELNLLRESSEGEKQFLLKERDDLIAKNTEINITLQKVEVELSDLTYLHAEVEQNHSETLKSLDELKIEKEIATKQFHADAVEWETKMNELAAKLAKEVDERIKEKTLYTNEISKISSEASAEREKYLHAMTSSEGKYLKLKEDFEAEKEKYANLKEESSVKISSLKDILEEKEQLSKQLQELLDTARQDVCALNDTIQNSSNHYSEEVRIHTEKIYKLESIIKENKLQLVAENENAEKLRAEISVLNESLREETEKNATREQLHLEEVEKLKSMISKNNGEFERLKQHLSNQTREIEDITEKLAQEISSKTQLQKEAEEVQNIRSTLKELEDTLSMVVKEKDSETKKKEQAISEANHFKVQMEHENENLRRNYDTEVEKVKNISQQLRNIQSSIKDKDDSIQELETTIFELRDSLEKETTKVYMLEKTQESKDRENADLLREIQSLMDRVSQESLSTTSKIEKLEQSLKSKAAENEELGDLVNKLRQEKDEIKRSMEQELEDGKENLSKSFQQTINDLQYRIQELENEKRSNNDITDKKLEDLSERISELSIIKEALQDENALLKEKIMEEKSSREQIDRKNKALKTALYENERQVREEMRELESTMHMTISKIETKRKKAVEEERNKLSSTLDKLESENDVYKIKIVQLESTIRHLESRLSVEQSLQGNGDNAIGDNSSFDDLKRENDELRSQLHLLQQQQQQQQHSPPKDRSSYSTPNHHHHQGRNHSDDTTHSHYYSMEYHLEKERRIKAEEFAAAMAARAKAGFEERNQEILALRVKVSTLESEKEIFRKQQTLLLEGDTLQNQTALSRPAALTLAIQQRDEALEEAKRYRSIAKKLNSHVQYLNQWVDNSADDNRGRIKASFGAGNNVIIGADDSSTLSSKKVGNDLNSSHGFGV